jgi:hypothetical protein
LPLDWRTLGYLTGYRWNQGSFSLLSALLVKTAFHVSKLTREQVPEVLVDLKRRILGDFYVVQKRLVEGAVSTRM